MPRENECGQETCLDFLHNISKQKKSEWPHINKAYKTFMDDELGGNRRTNLFQIKKLLDATKSNRNQTYKSLFGVEVNSLFKQKQKMMPKTKVSNIQANHLRLSKQ